MNVVSVGKASRDLLETYDETTLSFTTQGNSKVSKTLYAYGSNDGLTVYVDSSLAGTVYLEDVNASTKLGVAAYLGSASLAAGSYSVADVGDGTLSSASTLAKTSVTTSESYTVTVTEAGAGDTQGTVTGTVNLTNPLTGGGTIDVTVDGGTPVTVTLVGTENQAATLLAFNTALGSSAVASVIGGKLRITSATQGASSTVDLGAASTQALGGQLGVEDGSGAANVTTVDGTNGTGRFTVTPASSGVATTYHAGTVLVTQIPGITLAISSTASHAGESMIVKSVGQVGALHVSSRGMALGPCRVVVTGASAPTIKSASVRLRKAV